MGHYNLNLLAVCPGNRVSYLWPIETSLLLVNVMLLRLDLLLVLVNVMLIRLKYNFVITDHMTMGCDVALCMTK